MNYHFRNFSIVKIDAILGAVFGAIFGAIFRAIFLILNLAPACLPLPRG